MGNRSMFVGLDVHKETIDVSIAEGHRHGEVRAIDVPDDADDARRDLVRAREDAVVVGTRARYRLKAFLLRQGRRYPGREGWTLPYRRLLGQPRDPSLGLVDRVAVFLQRDVLRGRRNTRCRNRSRLGG